MDISKVLIILGVLLIVIGLFMPIIGNLPGDISIRSEKYSFYFPIVSSLVISIFLSILFYFSKWFFK